MDFSPVWANINFLLQASWLTIWLSFFSFFIALFLGVFIGSYRSIGAPFAARVIMLTYIEIFRGTPLLVQLFFIYYALPQIGITLSPYQAAILGLSLNFGAYMSEIVRSSMDAIDKTQHEAAIALGMSRLTSLRYIIYPQALRIALPPLTNTFAAILKDSSLVSVLSITELTRAGQLIYVRTYEPFEIYLTLAIFYFVMTFSVSSFASLLERRLQN